MSHFVQRLTVNLNTEIRVWTLTKLEQDQNLILQAMREECQRIIELRHGANKIEEQDYL